MSKNKEKKSKLTLREKLEARRKELASKGGNYRVFFFKEGTTRLRPVQIEDDMEPGFEVLYYFVNKETGGFVSPATFGEKCAFNEEYLKLKDSKNDKDKKLAKRIKLKIRFLMPHIRYKDEKGKEVDEEAGVKPALLTKGLYAEVLDLFLDEDEAGDFTDPVNGYDLKYVRVGSGQFDTEYSVRACKPTKCPKAFAKKKWNPEEMARELCPTYKETKAHLAEFLSLPMDDDDEDEKPKKKGKKDKKKKRKADL
jgi:hypothetical protein